MEAQKLFVPTTVLFLGWKYESSSISTAVCYAQNAGADAKGVNANAVALYVDASCCQPVPSRGSPEPTQCVTHKCGLSDAFERGCPDPETRSCAPRALTAISRPPPVVVARIRPGVISGGGDDVNEVNRIICEIANTVVS